MNTDQRDSRMLREGMFAGLKFAGGWWFIQVVGTEFVELKPWILQNSNENRAAIAAQTAGVNDDEITDSQGRLIVEPNDSERNTVFQIMYGIAPSRMQVFELYGRDRNRSIQEYDAPSEPGAYTTGFDSPYDNPTRESELFYVNSQSPLRLQAYNPMDEATEARLSFHVNKLRYTTVTDKGLMKAMLQGQQPARFAMLGGGVQNRNQSNIPNWVNEAFSEHIHTTEEILGADSSQSQGSSPLPTNAANLESIRGG